QSVHCPRWRAISTESDGDSSPSTKESMRTLASAQVMASAQPSQPRLQVASRVVEAAHDGALGAIERLADLFVREAVHFAQKYDGAMFGGQFIYGLDEARAELGAARVVEGLVALQVLGRRGNDVLAAVRGVRTELHVAPFAALMVDAEVHPDAIDPGLEARV